MPPYICVRLLMFVTKTCACKCAVHVYVYACLMQVLKLLRLLRMARVLRFFARFEDRLALVFNANTLRMAKVRTVALYAHQGTYTYVHASSGTHGWPGPAAIILTRARTFARRPTRRPTRTRARTRAQGCAHSLCARTYIHTNIQGSTNL